MVPQGGEEDPIPIHLLQSHAMYARKPGPILASQILQQFGAPLLLQPASTTAAPSDKTSTSAAAPSYTPSNPTLLGKHEAKVQAELEALGFGTPNVPLWPSYNDRETIEAFNALRIDIATMINYNIRIEELNKEKLTWKARIAQIKDEATLGTGTSPHDGAARGGAATGTEAGGGAASGGAAVGVPGKKGQGRPSGSGDRSVKKPRKSSTKRSLAQPK